MFEIECELMEYDVVIVGGGLFGLFVVIWLKQINFEFSVVLLEKGFEIGVYILFGVVLDMVGLDKLIFDWKEKGVLVEIEVIEDNFFIFGEGGYMCVLNWFMLFLMLNYGKYIVSMGNVCCWLVEQVEVLEVEIFLGMVCL